jgi:ABC-2 type transport system ATP-binding protein
MSVIAVRDVSKSFKKSAVVEHVTLDIEEGVTYGLVGPNGSGKSVLLQLMCGFLSPDSGTVSIDSRFLDEHRSFPDRFGVTINGPGYIGGLSGIRNLMLLAEIRKRSDLAEVEEVLRSVGLDPTSRQKVRSYSTGMKQKLSLAQAFMEEPEVLILDEPLNALDESSVKNIKSVLRSYKASGKTIVFTSHLGSDVEDLSDVVLRIENRQVHIL